MAIPAWSVPGSQRHGLPDMRAKRVMMSCKVTNMACPMCNLPVTFGGGIAMEKGGPVAVLLGWNMPFDSHLPMRRQDHSAHGMGVVCR